jgi:signal peptidase I
MFKIVSNSMVPFLQINDIVIIKRIEYTHLIKNDIVCINGNDRYIVHRLIKICGNAWMTKGDNNKYCDSTLLLISNYLGKVQYIIRNEMLANINSGNISAVKRIDIDQYFCEIENNNFYFTNNFTFIRYG